MPETPSRLPAGLLQRYALATRARGIQPGERRASGVGTSLEYFEERPYQPGDDPRAVNWRGYARTGRLSTRLFHAERAASVHILLDESASMQLHGKREWAHAAIHVLALAARHEASLQLHVLGGKTSPPLKGPALRPLAIERFLNDATSEGESPVPAEVNTAMTDARPLASELAQHLLQIPSQAGTALMIVISDLLDPAPLTPLLQAARARRMELLILQTLAEEERNPAPADLELHDVEYGDRIEVSPEDVVAYKEALRLHEAKLRREVLDAGQRWIALTSPVGAGNRSTQELESRAFHALVQRGVLQRR